MPSRSLSITQVPVGLVIRNTILTYIFYQRGGNTQKIVTSKINTSDIRSAIIIDCVMVYWASCRREYSLTLYLKYQTQIVTLKIIISNIGKATNGLLISVIFALLFSYLLSS